MCRRGAEFFPRAVCPANREALGAIAMWRDVKASKARTSPKKAGSENARFYLFEIDEVGRLDPGAGADLDELR